MAKWMCIVPVALALIAVGCESETETTAPEVGEVRPTTPAPEAAPAVPERGTDLGTGVETPESDVTPAPEGTGTMPPAGGVQGGGMGGAATQPAGDDGM